MGEGLEMDDLCVLDCCENFREKFRKVKGRIQEKKRKRKTLIMMNYSSSEWRRPCFLTSRPFLLNLNLGRYQLIFAFDIVDAEKW